MIKATLYTLAFLFPIILVQAQDTALLGNYLLAHRYSVDINSEHAFAMLPGMMVGKNLFILGEGGHHDLELYDNLKPAILSQLAQHNLKYFLVWGFIGKFENKISTHAGKTIFEMGRW